MIDQFDPENPLDYWASQPMARIVDRALLLRRMSAHYLQTKREPVAMIRAQQADLLRSVDPRQFDAEAARRNGKLRT